MNWMLIRRLFVDICIIGFVVVMTSTYKDYYYLQSRQTQHLRTLMDQSARIYHYAAGHDPVNGDPVNYCPECYMYLLTQGKISQVPFVTIPQEEYDRLKRKAGEAD
jgi:hypothetical protein